MKYMPKLLYFPHTLATYDVINQTIYFTKNHLHYDNSLGWQTLNYADYSEWAYETIDFDSTYLSHQQNQPNVHAVKHSDLIGSTDPDVHHKEFHYLFSIGNYSLIDIKNMTNNDLGQLIESVAPEYNGDYIQHFGQLTTTELYTLDTLDVLAQTNTLYYDWSLDSYDSSILINHLTVPININNKYIYTTDANYVEDNPDTSLTTKDRIMMTSNGIPNNEGVSKQNVTQPQEYSDQFHRNFLAYPRFNNLIINDAKVAPYQSSMDFYIVDTSNNYYILRMTYVGSYRDEYYWGDYYLIQCQLLDLNENILSIGSMSDYSIVYDYYKDGTEGNDTNYPDQGGDSYVQITRMTDTYFYIQQATMVTLNWIRFDTFETSNYNFSYDSSTDHQNYLPFLEYDLDHSLIWDSTIDSRWK